MINGKAVTSQEGLKSKLTVAPIPSGIPQPPKMFRTMIHIAFSFILVEGFKIVNVEPTTISQIDPWLSVSWTDEGGEESFPIEFFLAPLYRVPLESEKGNVVIDGNVVKNPILVSFQNIPLPGQLYLVPLNGQYKGLDGYQPTLITVTPGPPASSGSQTSMSVGSQSNSLTISTPTTTQTVQTSISQDISATRPSGTTPSSSSSTLTSGNGSSGIPISSPSSQEPARNSKSRTGVIVGSVIVGLVIISGVGFIIYRRRRKARQRAIISPYPDTQGSAPAPQPKDHRRAEVADIPQEQSLTRGGEKQPEDTPNPVEGITNQQLEGTSQEVLPTRQRGSRVDLRPQKRL
ncbi:hypothetical protein Moror_3273, partial [Moniliophthora roreri MCA 2997]